MNGWQRAIKYFAMALAITLVISIIGGIMGVLGILKIFGQKDNSYEEQIKNYSIDGEIENIYIKINAGELLIEPSDSFSLTSNTKNIKIKNRNKTLVIEENKHFNFKSNKAVFTLKIPKDYKFNDVDIKVGASIAKIDSITAENFSVECGAGDVKLSDIKALSSVDIECGAGKLYIANSKFNNLDFDLGAGKTDFSGIITGNSEIECSAGDADFKIFAEKNDYKIVSDKGIGKIIIDGESLDGKTILGNGTNRIEIKGGISDFSMNFN